MPDLFAGAVPVLPAPGLRSVCWKPVGSVVLSCVVMQSLFLINVFVWVLSDLFPACFCCIGSL